MARYLVKVESIIEADSVAEALEEFFMVARNVAKRGKGTCPRVNKRVCCDPCGYPFCEAAKDTDDTPHLEIKKLG